MTDNPLANLRLRETIDLRERVDEIRETLLPELDRRIDAAEDEDADPLHPEDDAAALRQVRQTLAGQATACERVVEAFDLPDGEPCAFTIQELLTAETALLTDDVTEQSVDVDYERQTASGAPKQGYHKVRTLELSLVDWPQDMPTRHDPDIGRHVARVGQLPDHVTDYLYQCAVALNDAQEVAEVGNLSDYGVPPVETSSG